ncbi:MAG: CvpA family protein [Bacteroidales bacterium]|nr:CvpA family protein [Bacteroidales bacterium]
MNLFDIIVIIFVGWNMVRGFMKGFVQEIFQIVGYGLGIFIAFKFSDWLAQWLRNEFSIDAAYTFLIAFALLFIGTVILCFMISKMVESIFHIMQISTINKLLGLAFSTLKALILMSFIAVAISKLDKANIIMKEEQRERSLTFYPLVHLGETIIPILDEKWSELSRNHEDLESSANMNEKIP